MPVRIGVIGTGLMGAHHAATISQHVAGATLTAVSRNIGQISAETGPFNIHPDPFALIDDPDVDAVVIASPDDTHVELVLACIEQAKPVLCEKPLAPHLEDCLRIIDAEMAKGRRFVQVGFHRRFDPGYVALRQFVVDGACGVPVMLHAVHRNTKVPDSFTSEMIIANAGVHDIDIARWLLGTEIIRVRIFKSPHRSASRIIDPQFLVMETEHGVLVTAEVFMNATYGYDIQAEVVCERGTARLTGAANIDLRHAGVEVSAVPQSFQARFATAYCNQLQTWVNCIRTGTSSGASAWDGYVATAIAGACLRSLATGTQVDVSLDPSPNLYR